MGDLSDFVIVVFTVYVVFKYVDLCCLIVSFVCLFPGCLLLLVGDLADGDDEQGPGEAQVLQAARDPARCSHDLV